VKAALSHTFLVSAGIGASFIARGATLDPQPTPASARAIVVAPGVPHVAMALSRIDERSVGVKLDGAGRGKTVVHLHNLRDQTTTTVSVDTAGASFALPAPWDGELMVIRPAAPRRPAEPALVAVVVEPIVAPPAGEHPRTIFGPSGWSSVRFEKDAVPLAGTQVFITSPAVSKVAPPEKAIGDPVEIGLMPAQATTAIVGLSFPLQPAERLVLSVYDPKRRGWTALPSRAARDGMVYATASLPGIFALTVPR
jgi:hypothetical protein